MINLLLDSSRKKAPLLRKQLDIDEKNLRWNRKIYNAHELEELILLKWSHYSKGIYRFNVIPIKIPMAFFTELEQMIIRFVYAYYRLQIAKAMLKNNKGSCLLISSYTTNYIDQNSVVLAGKQKNRTEWEPRNKPIFICSVNLQHGEGNGKPLPYSYLENSMDRGACRATVHGVTKGQIWLSDWTQSTERRPEYTMVKRLPFQTVLRILDSYMLHAKESDWNTFSLHLQR